MHRATLIILLTLAVNFLPAEAFLPAPFVDIMHAHHDGAFYDQQAEDWKDVVTGDCSTDEAWFHYYKTANYSNRFGSGQILRTEHRFINSTGPHS